MGRTVTAFPGRINWKAHLQWYIRYKGVWWTSWSFGLSVFSPGSRVHLLYCCWCYGEVIFCWLQNQAISIFSCGLKPSCSPEILQAFSVTTEASRSLMIWAWSDAGVHSWEQPVSCDPMIYLPISLSLYLSLTQALTSMHAVQSFVFPSDRSYDLVTFWIGEFCKSVWISLVIRS